MNATATTRAMAPHRIELARPGFTWPPEMRPQKWELNALQPGRIVRLYLRTGQAIWCRVTSAQQRDGCYLATVEDTVAPDLQRGAQLRFCKQDVFEIA